MWRDILPGVLAAAAPGGHEGDSLPHQGNKQEAPGNTQEPYRGGDLGLLECLCAAAPRPLFVCAGGQDPRCPIAYVQEAAGSAGVAAYGALRVCVDEGAGHEVTPAMWRETLLFLRETLRRGAGAEGGCEEERSVGSAVPDAGGPQEAAEAGGERGGEVGWESAGEADDLL